MEVTLIVVINPKRGMYAAEVDGKSEFVIFELIDSCEPEIGDEEQGADRKRRLKSVESRE